MLSFTRKSVNNYTSEALFQYQKVLFQHPPLNLMDSNIWEKGVFIKNHLPKLNIVILHTYLSHSFHTSRRIILFWHELPLKISHVNWCEIGEMSSITHFNSLQCSPIFQEVFPYSVLTLLTGILRQQFSSLGALPLDFTTDDTASRRKGSRRKDVSYDHHFTWKKWIQSALHTWEMNADCIAYLTQ